jgi:hypothetical protein
MLRSTLKNVEKILFHDMHSGTSMCVMGRRVVVVVVVVVVMMTVLVVTARVITLFFVLVKERKYMYILQYLCVLNIWNSKTCLNHLRFAVGDVNSVFHSLTLFCCRMALAKVKVSLAAQ